MLLKVLPHNLEDVKYTHKVWRSEVWLTTNGNYVRCKFKPFVLEHSCQHWPSILLNWFNHLFFFISVFPNFSLAACFFLCLPLDRWATDEWGSDKRRWRVEERVNSSVGSGGGLMNIINLLLLSRHQSHARWSIGAPKLTSLPGTMQTLRGRCAYMLVHFLGVISPQCAPKNMA